MDKKQYVEGSSFYSTVEEYEAAAKKAKALLLNAGMNRDVVRQRFDNLYNGCTDEIVYTVCNNPSYVDEWKNKNDVSDEASVRNFFLRCLELG